ncbi:hypothetical protein [Thermosipho atlanticus]|uniref:Cupin domain-containing protein n=1 Tax=Thermosipho atlanticus DSM 15807 TaxID=1123380 RepID=A0A1M5RC97_9BACT|nr:hypothetical protein [Thermosipho atlanticus]SHH23760.1 hypothetical protein SAMN02745199_0452 [Thermosipho atlanticus DSM 15807]
MNEVRIYKNIFEDFLNEELNITLENYLKVSELVNFSGEPEKHLNFTDVYIVLDGNAVLYFGKELELEVEVSEGEYRGKAIKNPQKIELEKNTVVIIPANNAHKLDVPDKLRLIVLKLKIKNNL